MAPIINTDIREITRRAMDLFDEMSIAGLETADEKVRQDLRKIFTVGFQQGYTQGQHDAVMGLAAKQGILP